MKVHGQHSICAGLSDLSISELPPGALVASAATAVFGNCNLGSSFQLDEASFRGQCCQGAKGVGGERVSPAPG